MSKYDVIIGLETHAELKTNTKIFCACPNEFGSQANQNTCPVCTGQPGALPMLNKKAVQLCIKAGLCFGSSITEQSEFLRKSYFYPDLSKAYQISQLEKSICIGGYVMLDNGKKIRINRIQLEEDAGKLTHEDHTESTLIDYNRAGTPLIEMVTEPDFESAEEVDEYLKIVRENLMFQDIADCKMEEGGMRCDVNISLKPKGSAEFGAKVEMKNLNSFKSIVRAIAYEISRQQDLLDDGKQVQEETRKWDDNRNASFAMRKKEKAQDYRYFADPDLLQVQISDQFIAEVKSQMGELPWQIRERYIGYGINIKEAAVLTSSKYISNYFDNCIKEYDNAKKISNWIITDLLKIIKEEEKETFDISEKHLTDIVKMVEDKTINKTVGLQLLDQVIKTKKEPGALAKEMGLLNTVSKEQIVQILEQFKENNAKAVSDYKLDAKKVEGFIFGFVMKNTGGKAKIDVVKECIAEVMSK